MRYKTDALAKNLFPIIQAGKPYIFKHPKVDFSDIGDKKLEHALDGVRNLLGATMRASLQLSSIYDDTAVCHKMIGAYPWKPNRVSKAQHLHFVWAQFTNLCYLFEERFKLFMNLQHRSATTFGKRRVYSITEGVKTIRKSLGSHIRQRGQNTHEWSTSNPHAEHFASIEFINSIEPQEEGPLGNVAGQFRITRLLMRWEIENGIHFMEDFLLELFDKQIPELVGYASIFNELIERARNNEVTIKGNEITNAR